jgi:fibronectin-binding autotransporter adhesin
MKTQVARHASVPRPDPAAYALGGQRLSRRAAAALAAALATVAVGRAARAAAEVWDPAGTVASGGTGTWDVATTPSWDLAGVPANLWTNGNSATFNGSAGTVNVSGGVVATATTVTTYGYVFNSINGGTLTSPAINYTPATSGGTLTLNVVLAGTGGVVLSGSSYASTIALTGANTFTGVAEMVQDTVTFTTLANGGTSSSFGAGSDNVYVGGSLTSASGSSTGAVYVGTGAGTTNRLWAITGTSTSDSISDNSSNTTGGPLSFTNTGVAVAGAVGARTINFGGTYTASANTFAESITDLGTGANITAVKVSGDKWTLSGTSSTYTGATTVTSGTLSGIGGQVFGNTSGISVGGAAVLGLLGDASTTFATATTATPYSVITTASGATINVDDATAAGATVVKTMTIGNISTSSVATTGVTFNFTGADDTSLTAGTVTGPNVAVAEVVTIANAIPTATGTLTLAGYNSSNTAGGETLTIGGVGNTTLTGPITPSATTLSVSKTGTATLSLLGSSTYTGGTNISSGMVNIATSGSLGTGPVVASLTANSNIFSTTGLTLANAITASSGFTTTLKDNGPLAGGTFLVSGLISGAGSVTVGTGSNGSDGPIELSDDSNSFTGTFGTSYGFIEFTSVANAGAVSALGAGTTAYVLTNSTSYETFQYRGANNDSTTRAINWAGTTGNLALDASGAGTVQYLSNAVLRSGSGVDTLVLQGTNVGANTLAQVVNDSTSGATSLSKIGAGTWVLAGANTYSGNTTISAGTLLASNPSGSATGTGAVTIAAGGTLGGSGGTISGTVAVNGTITAGTGANASSATGTLTTGTQTWNAGGKYYAKVNGGSVTGTPLAPVGGDATGDVLVMSGLSVPTTFNVSLAALGGGTTFADGAELELASVNSASGVFAGVLSQLTLTYSGVSFSGSDNALQLADVEVGSNDELVAEAVVGTPEPASVALLGLAAAPLLGVRRRRRALVATIA